MRFKEELRFAQHLEHNPVKKTESVEEPMRPRPPPHVSADRDVLHHVFFDFDQRWLGELLQRLAGTALGESSTVLGTVVLTDELRTELAAAVNLSRRARIALRTIDNTLRIEFGLDDAANSDAVASTADRWQSSPSGLDRLRVLLEHHRQATRIAAVTWDTSRALFLAVLSCSSVVRQYVFANDNEERRQDGLGVVTATVANTMTRHLPLFSERYITRTDITQRELVKHVGMQYVMNIPNVDIPVYARLHRHN